jgi:hypothetical protein
MAGIHYFQSTKWRSYGADSRRAGNAAVGILTVFGVAQAQLMPNSGQVATPPPLAQKQKAQPLPKNFLPLE